MSYTKGSLKFVKATDRCDACDIWDCCTHDEYAEDARRVPSDSSSEGYARPAGSVAWLPHSCEEWVIGGPEEVRALIDDLKLALKAMAG